MNSMRSLLQYSNTCSGKGVGTQEAPSRCLKFFGENKSASLRIRKRFENLKEGSEIDIGNPSSPRQELLFSCSHKYPVLQGLIMLQVDQGCFFIEHVYYQKNRTFVLFNSLISCFLFCICCCCQSCICLVIMAIISLSFKVFVNTS